MKKLVVLVFALAACQAGPAPTLVPTSSATPTPTGVATLAPTTAPTDEPTAAPTLTPTQSPTQSPTVAPTPSDPRTAGWQADLLTLIDFRERTHPDPWFGIPRDDYVADVESVIARIPELNDDELLVEATRLAAVPTYAGRDGHGGIYPWGEGTYGGHAYPLRMYWFSDGMFVVDALPPYDDLEGARVDAIGGNPIADVLAAAEPLVPRDNHGQVLSESPRLIAVSEILHGLGLLDEAGDTDFTFTVDGETVTRTISPIALSEFEAWTGGHHTLSPPGRSNGPLWLSDIEDSAWWVVDPETRVAYVSYNLVDYESIFVASDLAAALDNGEFDTLVVDLRHNPGGDNTTYGAFLSFVQRAAEELPGDVYMVTSRATFSAAGNFSTDVEQSTDAIFIGEDMGSSPNLYGDSRQIELTEAGLIFRVALRYWEKSTPDDPRITIEPDIEVLLSSADYFGDVDPVMEAILSRID